MRRTDHEIEGGRKLYLYSFGNPAAERQRKFWGSVGAAWREEARVIEEWCEPVTRALNNRIGDYPRLALDLGCGSGSMVLPPKWRVYGVDPASEMLTAPRAIQGDPEALPFQDGSFDAVVSRFAVMLSPDPVAAFSEVRRVLRMGGTFTFVVWAEASANRWVSVAEDILKSELSIRDPLPTEPHGYRLASPTETAELLAAARLRHLGSEQVLMPYFSQRTPEETLEFVLRFVGPVRSMFMKVPDERKESVRGAILAELAAVSRNGSAWLHHAEREVRFE